MTFRFLIPLLAFGGLLSATPLPVRGLQLNAPKPDGVQRLVKFIREVLPKEGVNTLVLEIDYRYQFKSHPEVTDANALSLEDARAIGAAAKQANVKLIPLVDLLGHQSLEEEKTTLGLLRSHPEFDETPGKYPHNEDIYCRSYCPLHPQLHAVLFDLIDEVLDAFSTDTFHAGMDEVFLLGEDDCPRCKGQNKAKLFAGEVRAIHDHLAEKGRHLWMWGDRLIDGDTTGIGNWEGSGIGTAPALLEIPRDVVICDWHYESAHATTLAFALAGFQAVTCPWRNPAVALRQLELIRLGRAESSEQVRSRLSGMLHTTWTPFEDFSAAYWRDGKASVEAQESALCFRELMRCMRQD